MKRWPHSKLTWSKVDWIFGDKKYSEVSMLLRVTKTILIILIVIVMPIIFVFSLLESALAQELKKQQIDIQAWDVWIDKHLVEYIIATDPEPHQAIRSIAMHQLIDLWFTDFVSDPYTHSEDKPYITTSDGTMSGDLVVQELWTVTDALDDYISMSISRSKTQQERKDTDKTSLHFSWTVYDQWSGIYLFQRAQDLMQQWYEIVSHRSRKNTDPQYRRHNISTAFAEFGSVRVVAPGESIRFLDEINYDPLEWKKYMQWYVIVQDEEQPEYGGWLCWASTALYQWILTNTALAPTEWRAHTKRYGDLYNAQINGEYISTPGIDSTIYDGHIDFELTNTAAYPIILVLNYDGEYGGIEEVFSLAKTQDIWSYNLISQRRNSSTIYIDGKPKSVRWWCYIWEVNGEERQSCYKEVH